MYIVAYIVCGFVFLSRFIQLGSRVEPHSSATQFVEMSNFGQNNNKHVCKKLFYLAFIYLRNSGKSRIYAMNWYMPSIVLTSLCHSNIKWHK